MASQNPLGRQLAKMGVRAPNPETAQPLSHKTLNRGSVLFCLLHPLQTYSGSRVQVFGDIFLQSTLLSAALRLAPTGLYTLDPNTLTRQTGAWGFRVLVQGFRAQVLCNVDP